MELICSSYSCKIYYSVKPVKYNVECHVRGGSRGRVQGVSPPPPPPEMTCSFLIQLVFCKKKNYVVYWC